MCRKLETWLCFLLSLAWISRAAYGLSCNFCQSANNYASCVQNGAPVECTEALVNVTHLLLVPHNPSLLTASPLSEFQCFQANYTVNGVTSYQMGCTFARSHICEGWTTLSQCRIVNGTATSNQQSNGTPAKPSVSSSISTTPRSASSSSRSTQAAHGSTSTTVTPTTDRNARTEGGSPTGSPDRSSSNANAVSIRFDLLLTLILLHWWSQNL